MAWKPSLATSFSHLGVDRTQKGTGHLSGPPRFTGPWSASQLLMIPTECHSSPGPSALQQVLNPGTAAARLTLRQATAHRRPALRALCDVHPPAPASPAVRFCPALPKPCSPRPSASSSRHNSGAEAPQLGGHSDAGRSQPVVLDQGHLQDCGSEGCSGRGSSPTFPRWAQIRVSHFNPVTEKSGWGPGVPPNWHVHRPSLPWPWQPCHTPANPPSLACQTPSLPQVSPPPSLLHLFCSYLLSCHPGLTASPPLHSLVSRCCKAGEQNTALASALAAPKKRPVLSWLLPDHTLQQLFNPSLSPSAPRSSASFSSSSATTCNAAPAQQCSWKQPEAPGPARMRLQMQCSSS